MRSRLGKLSVTGVQARTFHAAALRQLRFFWPSSVGGEAPRVAPTKAPLIGEAASRLRIRTDQTLVRDIAAEIEWAKVSQVPPESYRVRSEAASRGGVSELDAEVVARIYDAYEAVKRDRGVIDFEDVLLLSVAMLDDDDTVRDAVRGQYRCLLVDEYQDVSPVQQRLLDLWVGERTDITVVGDANQTIYSFAGATPDFLLSFPQRYPDAPVIRLERCYRSTPQVVNAANRLLRRPATSTVGRSIQPLTLSSQRDAGPEPALVIADNEPAEVKEVVSRIQLLAERGVPTNEIAVLYRINAQSVAFEEALAEAGVSYTVRGSERFFDRPEVRDALTLLRGAARSDSGPGDFVEQAVAALGSAGYRREPPAGPSKARDRWESLHALVVVARELASADPTATMSTLVDELSTRAANQHAPASGGVTLASLHAAKGLEWDAVFVVGLTDGMVPITYAVTPAQVDEECRLLYVGITRARTHLTLSFARARSAGDRRVRSPSPFIAGLIPDAAGLSANGPARRTKAVRPASCRSCGRALMTATERKLRHCSHCEPDIDRGLFEALRAWRKQTAEAASVPAFVVFTDATLSALAADRPTTAAGLFSIPGIGTTKVERYGDEVLAVVRTFGEDTPG
jgi:DNA helicase-2/ATP-dependent DNA helicase PcrA